MLPNGYLHNKSRNDYSWIFQEVHRSQKEADESNKRASVLERDNQRFEVQLADMSQQVRPDGTTEASVSYGREKMNLKSCPFNITISGAGPPY